jgi:hypothetical protein
VNPLTERGFVLFEHLTRSEEQIGASQHGADLIRSDAGPAGPAMSPGPPSGGIGLFRRAIVIVVHLRTFLGRRRNCRLGPGRMAVTLAWSRVPRNRGIPERESQCLPIGRAKSLLLGGAVLLSAPEGADRMSVGLTGEAEKPNLWMTYIRKAKVLGKDGR